MIKTLEELSEQYIEESFKSRFCELFTLSIFYKKSIIPIEYIVSEKLGESIVLSKSGLQLYAKLKETKFEHTTELSIKFAIFLDFYHQELYIDIENSNIKNIIEVLDSNIKNKDILYPWIYGRLLYDKYFENFLGEDRYLQNKEVLKLLQDTPNGVFQMSNYLIGPFGILKTKTSRALIPTKNVHLWHCSDPSCSQFHKVYLKSSENEISKIIDEINKIHSNIKSSEWSRFYFNLIEPENYFYDQNRTTEIHSLIINTLGNNELKVLLKEIIDSNKDIRKSFPNNKKIQGSSEKIVADINKDECFQLLLLEDDIKIIKALEKLIENGIIDIPATEIRRSNLNLSGSFYDVRHEVNRLGIRSVLQYPNQSLVRLTNLIEVVHNSHALKEDLQWKLMVFQKDTINETIENYILSVEPRKVIKDSIIDGRLQTKNAIESFNGNFTLPLNQLEKEKLIDKILWKLGFDINIYPSLLEEFWFNLNLFKQSVNQKDAIEKNERDDIRSFAVNFFVRLEEVLENTLSYITWVLLSDQFIDTHFKYNFEDARDLMCEKLNGSPIGDNETLRLDNSGNNNLFSLIQGFSALVEVCDNILLNDNENYKRPEDEVPHFHTKAELTAFPFIHKILLLDIKEKKYNNLKSVLDSLQRDFSRENVASVRNRLEHKNRVKNRVDNFPSPEEILNASKCCEDTISKLVEYGIFPNVFLFNNSTKDKFNRITYELEDYKGNTITLRPLPRHLGSHLPSYKKPQVVSSLIQIGNSGEFLRFEYQQTSEYLKFWKNFPRKKSDVIIENNENSPYE